MESNLPPRSSTVIKDASLPISIKVLFRGSSLRFLYLSWVQAVVLFATVCLPWLMFFGGWSFLTGEHSWISVLSFLSWSLSPLFAWAATYLWNRFLRRVKRTSWLLLSGFFLGRDATTGALLTIIMGQSFTSRPSEGGHGCPPVTLGSH